MYCKNKYVSLFLALIMIIATCISASATKNVNIQGPKGALTLDEEKALAITEKVEDIAKRRQKEAMVDRQIKTTRSSVEDYIRTLNVPTFQQAYSHYCGPANTKQVCHYHNGSSLTQDQYATRLGTTTAGTSSIYIQQVLAEDTGLNYIRSDVSSFETDQYIGWIKYGMDNSMPAILSIIVRNKGTAPSGIPYKTNGHFITTSGLDTKYDNQIRLTDTNGQWAGATWYDIDVVKKVNQANNYMVW